MGFQHKKRYGQNFLNDETAVLEKIIEVTKLSGEEHILEIGPGQGALTAFLLKKSRFLTCIEIDKDLENSLRQKFSKYKNFKLIMGDILELDFSKHFQEKISVIANIPYYITSPIIQKLIENKEYVTEAFLMVQKEVGERICAKKGSERSVLTLAVEYYGEAEYLFTIPKEHFQPVPKVDSAFIHIWFHEEKKYQNQVEENVFFHYIKAAFSNKRKNIVNNLSTLGYPKERIKKILATAGISEKERAENISIEDFIRLISYFENEN